MLKRHKHPDRFRNEGLISYVGMTGEIFETILQRRTPPPANLHTVRDIQPL